MLALAAELAALPAGLHFGEGHLAGLVPLEGKGKGKAGEASRQADHPDHRDEMQDKQEQSVPDRCQRTQEDPPEQHPRCRDDGNGGIKKFHWGSRDSHCPTAWRVYASRSAT